MGCIYRVRWELADHHSGKNEFKKFHVPRDGKIISISGHPSEDSNIEVEVIFNVPNNNNEKIPMISKQLKILETNFYAPPDADSDGNKFYYNDQECQVYAIVPHIYVDRYDIGVSPYIILEKTPADKIGGIFFALKFQSRPIILTRNS